MHFTRSDRYVYNKKRDNKRAGDECNFFLAGSIHSDAHDRIMNGRVRPNGTRSSVLFIDC